MAGVGGGALLYFRAQVYLPGWIYCFVNGFVGFAFDCEDFVCVLLIWVFLRVNGRVSFLCCLRFVAFACNCRVVCWPFFFLLISRA